MNSLCISFLSCYAPLLLNQDSQWQNWANGLCQIPLTDESPKLEFTSALFRRRLSQLTKMCIQTIHDTFEKSGRIIKNDDGTFSYKDDVKLFFAGTTGEINREFQINEQLIKEQEILPASFSLSVFNTAVAQATLAFKIHSGYTAAFASKGNFFDSFASAASTVLCGDEKQILFVWGQEKAPDEYRQNTFDVPLSFSFILSSDSNKKNAQDKLVTLDECKNDTAVDFLKRILLKS